MCWVKFVFEFLWFLCVFDCLWVDNGDFVKVGRIWEFEKYSCMGWGYFVEFVILFGGFVGIWNLIWFLLNESIILGIEDNGVGDCGLGLMLWEILFYYVYCGE